MIDTEFKIIEKKDIFSIIPLLRLINQKTPDELLKTRLLEMLEQNYRCAGMYSEQKLIGICGIWTMTRHYIGKSAEVDHVVIDPDYSNKKLGNLFFEWIHKYLTLIGVVALEFNTFVENIKSIKFYYNEGYEIFGFHMLKVLREDANFY